MPDVNLRKERKQLVAKWRYFLLQIIFQSLIYVFPDAAHMPVGNPQKGSQVMQRNFL